MILKESEAKAKWCPFVRAMHPNVAENISGINRPHHLDAFPEHHCIASACMAWRIIHADQGMRGTHVPVGGYCGLAGKPTP